MNTILNLLLLTIIICFIIDLSGFTYSLKKIIAYKLKPYFSSVTPDTIKLPFISCSLCTVFWVGLIYLIITKEFSLINLCYVVGLSFFSSNISGFLGWIKDLLATIEGKLFKFLR